jgi:hypothetical protein
MSKPIPPKPTKKQRDRLEALPDGVRPLLAPAPEDTLDGVEDLPMPGEEPT